MAWTVTAGDPCSPRCLAIANGPQVRDIRGMEPTLEEMARALVKSGDYRVTSRLEGLAEYHLPDNNPKLVAAVVDVETTGTNPERDKIIELCICLFEFDRQNGRIYKVLGSWDWFEDRGTSIPSEITKITGIDDEMVAGRSIDHAVSDLLSRGVLAIAHNADFDHRFLERRVPAFAAKHWACNRADIDWKAEGIRSSALEFIAYSLGFFHGASGGERLPSHRPYLGTTVTRYRPAGLAGPPGTRKIADMAVMGKGRWHREEGYPQGPRLLLEPRRVRATEMLVSRYGGRPIRR